jgi:hypothetical protein
MANTVDQQMWNKFCVKPGKTTTATYVMLKFAFGEEIISHSRTSVT